MKTKIKYIILLIASMQSSFLFAQQDPQYSQYNFNHMAIKPAYAGSKEALALIIDSRTQWVNMPGAPKTNALSLHTPLKGRKLNVGLHTVRETIGPKKWGSVYGDFAYRFKIGNSRLSFGLSAGVVNYVFDWSQIQYKDDGESGPTYQGANRTDFDFNTGFYYNSNSFYAGGSITHINSPNLYQKNNSLGSISYRLRPHTFLYLGKGWQLSEKVIFNPTIMIKMQNLANLQIDFSANVLLAKKLWLGTSVRTSYGFAFLMQYNISEKFKIGYSYDKGLNQIGTVGKSSHELMLGYNFDIFKTKMISPRYL